MKKRQIKKFIFIVILIIIISLFFYLKFKKYTYEVTYTINNYKILEKYNKETFEYTFIINYQDKIFPYNFANKYIRDKELINDIKLYTNGNETCIMPMSDKIEFYPICNNDSTLTFYNLSNIEINDYKYDNITKNNLNNEKITINYLNKYNYLLYNYKGFYYINNDNITNIELFNKDVYSIDLVYELNEYLIIADYNEDYYFSKIYVIDMKNGKIKEIEFDYDISFNSVFLGNYKDNIYLLDKKEKKEYKINLKKLEVTKCDYLILENNKLVKKTYNKIVNNNLKFDNFIKSNYEVIDNKLYQLVEDNKILVTDKEVDKIIKEEDNTIYYLVKENLYMYNNIYGEVPLISNFEWNFNNTNMIYLYK